MSRLARVAMSSQCGAMIHRGFVSIGAASTNRFLRFLSSGFSVFRDQKYHLISLS